MLIWTFGLPKEMLTGNPDIKAFYGKKCYFFPLQCKNPDFSLQDHIYVNVLCSVMAVCPEWGNN